MKDKIFIDSSTKNHLISFSNKLIDSISSFPTYNELKSITDNLSEKLSYSIESAAKEEKIWGLFNYDTAFTVIVTLLVFITGIIIDRWIKFCEKKKEQKELRYYFKHYVDKITDKTCTQLIEMYENVYKTNDINTGIPTAPPKILTGNYARIRNIQDKDLFHSFKDKESLSKILGNLDFLELMIGEIDNFHKRIRNESDEIKKPLQENVTKYFDTLGKYVENVRINNPQYPNVKPFRDMVNDSILVYHQDPIMKKKFSVVYKKLIRPIQEQVVDTNIFRFDPIGGEIAELGKNISHQYNFVMRMTIDFRLAYRKYSRHVRESQDALKNAREKINWADSGKKKCVATARCKRNFSAAKKCWSLR